MFLVLLGVLCADSLKALDFKELEFKFEVADAEATLPVKKLNEKYDAQLQALAAKAQAEGNLEKVLAINKERKSFETALTATRSEYDDLNRLQKIYYGERRKLRRKILEKQLKLLNTFEKSIRRLHVFSIIQHKIIVDTPSLPLPPIQRARIRVFFNDQRIVVTSPIHNGKT